MLIALCEFVSVLCVMHELLLMCKFIGPSANMLVIKRMRFFFFFFSLLKESVIVAFTVFLCENFLSCVSRCRILGFNSLDGLVTLTMEE